MKRYRSPSPKEGQIIAKKGKVDGEIDMCIFYGDNVPRCDRALVMHALFSESYLYDSKIPVRSLAEEMESRGYDMDTFKFSIEKKSTKNIG